MRRVLEAKLLQADQGTQESAGVVEPPQKKMRAAADDGGISTALAHEQLRSSYSEMQRVEELAQQRTEIKHNYGSPLPQNRGKVCGVCAAKRDAGCAGWGMGRPKRACFSCQVLICSWDCLNEHNKYSTGRTANTKGAISRK